MAIFDPRTMPLEALAGEPDLEPFQLREGWIRSRFIAPPLWQPEPSEVLIDLGEKPFIPAATLLPLIMRERGVTLLLTTRAKDLPTHSGQVSFPGGVIDAIDDSPIDAALRETHEEIGVPASKIEVLGTLPLYYTATGYCIHPVVGMVSGDVVFYANTREVAEIFEVPLDYLMSGQRHERRYIEQIDVVSQEIVKRYFYAILYRHHFIWGATAGMIRHLFHLLRA